MTASKLLGLWAVNGGAKLGCITGEEHDRGLIWYVGFGLDGLPWRAAAPQILAEPDQVWLRAKTSKSA